MSPFKWSPKLLREKELTMNHRKLLALGLLSFAQNAFAQDPPATKTNLANEAAEDPAPKPVRKPSGGGNNSAMKKFAQPAAAQGLYGVFDVRHTTNDYFDANGARIKRDPALHGKLRMGGKFYAETLDLSVGVGGSKLPSSQRTYQNRPDITVDSYPLKGKILKVLVYGNAMFPVHAEDLDPTEFADGDRYDRDYRRAMGATVMSFGVAPNIKLENITAMGRFQWTAGADAWTRLYSRPLYIEETDGSRPLGLVSEKEPPVSAKFEDRALRYVHQETLAVGFAPMILPTLQLEAAGYIENRYIPRYYRETGSEAWQYTYEPERVSFSRYKVAYDMTPSVSLSNELYFFRNGFFAGNRINDERRYRNIVRLSFKL
jgi:hypothetical protein